MVVLMVLAQVYGVVQLAVLGWAARTVRFRVLVLAMLAGLYAAAPAAALLQVAWTRAFAALSGVPLAEVTTTASYTLDPLIEELAKVAPLVVLWWALRSLRRQWAATDFVLAGAAIGAGFGLAEDLLRYADQAVRAVHLPAGGWIIPVGLNPPTVPGIGHLLGSWLPAGVAGGGVLGSVPGDAIDVHLVWSSLAGLGVALAVRQGQRRIRLAGLALVLLAAADHAAFNTQGVAGELARALATPLNATRGLIGLYPLAVLAFAVWLDRREMAAANAGPNTTLQAERAAPIPSLGLARLAVARPPLSVLAVCGFVRLRRAWLLSGRHGEPDFALRQGLEPVAAALDRASDAGAPVWGAAVERLAATRPGGRELVADARALLRMRTGLLGLGWLLLLVPVGLYFVVGGVPSLAAVQDALTSRYLVWLVAVAVVAGALWTGRNLAAGLRRLPEAMRHPAADVPATAMLRLWTRAGSLVVSVLGLWLLVRGHALDGGLVSSADMLDALGQTLLVVALLLALGAIAADPPLAFALLDGGGAKLVGTGGGALAGQLAVSGVIGGIGVALMEGGDSSATPDGGSGRGSGERGSSTEGSEASEATQAAEAGQAGEAIQAAETDERSVAVLDYTAEELAQFADQHGGEGELTGRPSLEEIHRTLTSVEGSSIPGQNAVRFDYQGVRVIINRDLPWRSTAYFAGP